MAPFFLMLMLLKARYTPVAGTDPEYGQGAIERNDLAHREIEPFVWLIQVEEPADPVTWRSNLNAAVGPEHGSFSVACATAEEESAVASGAITLQR
jgi:hypothetical protein